MNFGERVARFQFLLRPSGAVRRLVRCGVGGRGNRVVRIPRQCPRAKSRSRKPRALGRRGDRRAPRRGLRTAEKWTPSSCRFRHCAPYATRRLCRRLTGRPHFRCRAGSRGAVGADGAVAPASTAVAAHGGDQLLGPTAVAAVAPLGFAVTWVGYDPRGRDRQRGGSAPGPAPPRSSSPPRTSVSRCRLRRSPVGAENPVKRPARTRGGGRRAGLVGAHGWPRRRVAGCCPRPDC
jgi:hypothetical protein